MLTVAAFLFAIGLLIAVHEYGHYRMAVACRVKVLRFSIGFGKPLFSWRSSGSATEFVVCAFPLGGYVKMLDQREGHVPDDERNLAFNLKPLRVRVAVVAAGPAANLVLAVALYALVNWSGVQYPAAVLASPEAGSIAASAGLIGGQRVERAGLDGAELHDIQSFEDLRWLLTRGAVERRDAHLLVAGPAQGQRGDVLLRLSMIDAADVDAELFRRIGISGPFTQPAIGTVMVGGAADKAGLREGDVVRAVGAVAVVDAQQLRQLIKASAESGSSTATVWRIDRGGAEIEIVVKPVPHQEAGRWVGKIGAYVGATPELVVVRYGVVQSVWQGLLRSWDIAVLTLRTMAKMLVGGASAKNLSGPLAIADYAGKSASMGVTQYLLFLALVSVSLGVLNLLPVPALDGGHLMYYLWEGVMGKPVSDTWMELLQRGGIAVLLVVMSIAIFNDINRLFG